MRAGRYLTSIDAIFQNIFRRLYLLAEADVIDAWIADPLKDMLVATNHAAMRNLAGLRIHVAGFLHHAVPALVTNIIDLDRLDGAFDLGHGVNLLQFVGRASIIGDCDLRQNPNIRLPYVAPFY